MLIFIYIWYQEQNPIKKKFIALYIATVGTKNNCICYRLILLESSIFTKWDKQYKIQNYLFLNKNDIFK